MKKFLIVFLIIFFAITKSILAENQEIAELEVVEVVKTEVLQNQEKAPVFPWTFRLNRFLLNIRKIITTDLIEKINIENEILTQEGKIISFWEREDLISKEHPLINNFVNRQELLINQLEKIENKERAQEVAEKIIEIPAVASLKQMEMREQLRERFELKKDFIEERIEQQDQFKEQKGENIMERQQELEGLKEERQEQVGQLREIAQDEEKNNEEKKQERIDVLENLKNIRDIGLEKLNQLRQDGREVIEQHKESIQNIQKPARPIQEKQQILSEIE